MSNGNASTICWAVHWAVGFALTLKCMTRRRSWASTIKTYRISNPTVGTTKKSIETRSRTGFSRNAFRSATERRWGEFGTCRLSISRHRFRAYQAHRRCGASPSSDGPERDDGSVPESQVGWPVGRVVRRGFSAASGRGSVASATRAPFAGGRNEALCAIQARLARATTRGLDRQAECGDALVAFAHRPTVGAAAQQSPAEELFGCRMRWRADDTERARVGA